MNFGNFDMQPVAAPRFVQVDNFGNYQKSSQFAGAATFAGGVTPSQVIPPTDVHTYTTLDQIQSSRM